VWRGCSNRRDGRVVRAEEVVRVLNFDEGDRLIDAYGGQERYDRLARVAVPRRRLLRSP